MATSRFVLTFAVAKFMTTLRRHLAPLVVTTLVCGACQSDQDSPTRASGADVQTEPAKIVVTLDGDQAVLEPHPMYCAVTAGGDDFIIRGGRADGDDDPGNNVQILSISGQQRTGAEMFAISYSPDDGNGKTHRLTIKGVAAPFMQGTVFRWSGQLDSGADFAVDVRCPAP